MNGHVYQHMQLVNDVLTNRLHERHLDRLAAHAAAARGADSGRHSLRRSIGHSIIRIGQRMAAESSMSSAQSAQG